MFNDATRMHLTKYKNVGRLTGQMTWYLRKRNKTKTVVTVKKKSPKSKIMSKVETKKEPVYLHDCADDFTVHVCAQNSSNYIL